METNIPTRKEAIELFKEYNQNASLIKHALAVESVMRHFAKKFGEDVEVSFGPQSGCLLVLNKDAEAFCQQLAPILNDQYYWEGLG